MNESIIATIIAIALTKGAEAEVSFGNVLLSLQHPEILHAEVEKQVQGLLSRHPELQAQALRLEAETQGLTPEMEDHKVWSVLEEIQEVLETELNKRDLTREIARNFDRDGLWARFELPELEAEMWSYARATLAQRKSIALPDLIGQMLNKFYNKVNSKLGWDIPQFTKYVLGMNGLWKAVQSKTGEVLCQSRVLLSKELENQLDLMQAGLPMVLPPKEVKGLSNGSYLGKGSHWSRKAVNSDRGFVEEFLNRQNHIRYNLNYEVYHDVVQMHVQLPERGVNKEGIDCSDDEWLAKCAAECRHHWRRDFIFTLFEILGIKDIYLQNFFDYRGRNYAFGDSVKSQGQDPDKGCLCFPKQTLTEEGYKWLKISITNNYNIKVGGKDLDKHSFEEALEFYDKELLPLTQIEDYEVFKEKAKELFKEADSPVCFYAQFLNAWDVESRKRQGLEPVTWSICHFDATCSGYQWMAAITGDSSIAKQVNMTHDLTRNDLYTYVYREMVKLGLPDSYCRAQAKDAVMTFGYGSLVRYRQIFKESANLFVDVMKKFPIYHHIKSCNTIWNYLGVNYSFHMPDGFEVYKEGKKIVTYKITINVNDTDIPVRINREEPFKEEKSKEMGPNIIHALDGFIARELTRMAGMDQNQWKHTLKLITHSELWEQIDIENLSRTQRDAINLVNSMRKTNYKSFKAVHILNKWNAAIIVPAFGMETLIAMLENMKSECYQISEIHDSFGVCPNNVQHLMNNYRMCAYMVATSRYWNSVMDELGVPWKEYKNSQEFCNEILESHYMLR